LNSIDRNKRGKEYITRSINIPHGKVKESHIEFNRSSNRLFDTINKDRSKLQSVHALPRPIQTDDYLKKRSI